MKLVEAAKSFLKSQAEQIANAQASQEAFNAQLEAKVAEHGIVAVSRAKRPLEM